ncbi:hypothetical protein AB1Y20_002577 [Prymnesium parvum]|uniref:JmjC domain-containing protein n=1 Tax=Prymnesium parvum TaxID=97485 RepID=A0AB34JBT1_PRYPA
MWLALAALALCEPWCVHPCDELNGDVSHECADCGASAATRAFGCQPAALTRVPVTPAGAAPLPPPPSPPCARFEAAELAALPPARLAAALSRPALIAGLIASWPALAKWNSSAAFAARFGAHGVLAKRVMRSDAFLAAAAGVARLEATLLPLSALLAAGGSDLHSVLYNGEQGNAVAEERLLDDIGASGDVSCPEEVLGRACGTIVLSLGGGLKGVEMANHGFAWIGLIAGEKLWYASPPEVPRPAGPSCSRRDQIEPLEGATICLQRPGEVMVVPTAWWHATCNLGEFTLGVGGQDACDLVDCTPPGPPGESARERHMRMVFCAQGLARSEQCFGPDGRRFSRAASETGGLRGADGYHGGERPPVETRRWVLAHEEWVSRR